MSLWMWFLDLSTGEQQSSVSHNFWVIEADGKSFNNGRWDHIFQLNYWTTQRKKINKRILRSKTKRKKNYEKEVPISVIWCNPQNTTHSQTQFEGSIRMQYKLSNSEISKGAHKYHMMSCCISLLVIFSIYKKKTSERKRRSQQNLLLIPIDNDDDDNDYKKNKSNEKSKRQQQKVLKQHVKKSWL